MKEYPVHVVTSSYHSDPECCKMTFLCDSEEVFMNQSEEQWQNQRLEVMNRIASSMESLTTAAIGILETLARNQETLNSILLHLISK
jgi:hypothetical protein